ncbi:hypothetical protein BX600DRAFT_439651 [Xylariales sp. PMI_506]|nr:hypothetical protein BX600DRAFT_439651 [Xylariales sp. PMI_506]
MEPDTSSSEVYCDTASLHSGIDKSSKQTATPLQILDMPDELLIKIFDAVNNPIVSQPTLYHFFEEPWHHDVASIKNVRLACRRFCNASSHLLITHIDVTVTSASVQHLEEVLQHPTISKGIQAIRVFLDYYSPSLADDTSLFTNFATKNIQQVARVTEYMRERTQRLDIPDDSILQLLGTYRRVEHSWQQMLINDPKDIADNDIQKDWAALKTVQDQYRRCLEDQITIMQNGAGFAQRVALAIRKAPTVRWVEFRTGFQEQRLGLAQLVDLIHDLPRLIKPQMLQSWPHEAPSGAATEYPLLELLVTLPLAIHRADVSSIIGFQTSLGSLPSNLPFNLTEGEVFELQALAKTIKVLIFRGFNPLNLENSESKHSPKTDIPQFLSTFTCSSSIRRLDLDFSFLCKGVADEDDPDDYPGNEYQHDLMVPPRLDSLLTLGIWPNLELLSLGSCSLQLEDLRIILQNSQRRVYVELKRTHMCKGSWAEALDLLRTMANQVSNVIKPSGAECASMTREEQDRIFKATYTPVYLPSVCSQYLRGLLDGNPLRSIDIG